MKSVMAYPSNPTLRFGSFGQPVQLLQNALNLGPSLLPKLAPDAQFGRKTQSRVQEFQGQKNLTRDGVVGPVTWGELTPFLELLQKIVDQNVPSSNEQEQRQRIVDVAKSALQTFGWGNSTPAQDGSARICAARGFGPAIAGRRARQGGPALASIYTFAGASAALCLSITTDMETVYQQDPNKHPDRRAKINQNDIGSWCGIFATYCYKVSGLNVNWDDVRTQSTTKFDKVLPNARVQKGDIGVFDPMINHHFIVREDAEPGARVYSIDGNVGNPREQDVTPWNSVIAERFYLRSTLTSKGGLFLRPKFSQMTK
jgi:hypothetical protein